METQCESETNEDVAKVALGGEEGDSLSVSPLTGRALGWELPAEMALYVEVLRQWAAREGPRAECALFCAFHPPIAALDVQARRVPGVGFNPTGVEDGEIGRARRTLILVRDSYLMPTIFDAEYAVLFSHAIAALADILGRALVTGLETDGVGEETG